MSATHDWPEVAGSLIQALKPLRGGAPEPRPAGGATAARHARSRRNGREASAQPGQGLAGPGREPEAARTKSRAKSDAGRRKRLVTKSPPPRTKRGKSGAGESMAESRPPVRAANTRGFEPLQSVRPFRAVPDRPAVSTRFDPRPRANKNST